MTENSTKKDMKDKEDKEYKGTLSVDKSLGWDLLSDECI